MEPQAERARQQFPSVLLGVLGIIQALALELVWEQGVGGMDRWRAADGVLAGWLEILAVFQGVVVVWVMYALVVLRHRWVPRFADLVFPFVLGALEFVLISQMRPDRLLAWFLLMAVIFPIAAGMSVSMLRTIRAERGDDGEAEPGLVTTAGPSLVAGLAIAVVGALAAWRGPASPVTVLSLCVANAGLAAQMLVFRRSWSETRAQI